MDITRAEQIALDDALVAPANGLKIGKSNLRLSSDLKSKEATLQEEFVYQVDNKNVKRRNEMYYPCFTKVIVNFFMTKDSSIPKRNRVNWHFAKDELMFTTIKELNLLKQKQVLRRSKLDMTRQRLLQLLKAKDSRLPPLSSATKLPPPTIPLITHLQQTPAPTPTTVPSSSLQDLPNFGYLFGFDHRLKTLETDFSEFKQTNQFAVAVSSIPDIVDAHLANKMHEAVKIVDQVKEQVKAQVSKILPKIDKTVNEQLEVEVLTRSSNESKTSHVVATNLYELELKKILIDKMESNKSIHRSDEQKNLYKALVDPYESDKLILDTYKDNRRRDGKEPESTSAPKEKTSKITSKSTKGSKSHHKSAQAEEPMHTVKDLEEPAHQEFVTGDTEDKFDEETSQHPDCTLAQKEDTHESFNELMDTPLDFLAFVVNRLKATTDQLDWNNPKGQQYPHDLRKPLPLIPNSRGRQVIPFDYFINNNLAYLSGGVLSRTYTTSVTKTKAADYEHIKWIEDLVPNRMEYACDVYSKHIIIDFIKLQIVEWHNYKHLDWITVHRDDDKMYTFKEGNFNRLRIQDIEDMPLLIVQGKLTNLTDKERLAFNVSKVTKRSSTSQSRICISDLKRREAYAAYSNPKGFIYQNKDKKNKLMRIDELHKFYDGTLNDVRTALNDRLKGIWMKYLPQTI
ncbi:hypothetical protein Tco_0781996 [Tanacetum coccineum]